MQNDNNSAVVTKHGDKYHVDTHRAHRGAFSAQCDAQLWAIMIATREPDIATATLLSGLIVTP